MLCSQGTVGATKAGANMVAAAPAATAAVARWERVVGMARRAETLGGYYVMEQNAANRKQTNCQSIKLATKRNQMHSTDDSRCSALMH